MGREGGTKAPSLLSPGERPGRLLVSVPEGGQAVRGTGSHLCSLGNSDPLPRVRHVWQSLRCAHPAVSSLHPSPHLFLLPLTLGGHAGCWRGWEEDLSPATCQPLLLVTGGEVSATPGDKALSRHLLLCSGRPGPGLLSARPGPSSTPSSSS